MFASLVREGLLDEKSVARVQELTAQGKALDDALREADGIPEDKLLRFFAGELQIPYMELEDFTPPKDLLARFPARLLLERKLLPVAEEPDGVITVATSKLFDT